MTMKLLMIITMYGAFVLAPRIYSTFAVDNPDKP